MTDAAGSVLAYTDPPRCVVCWWRHPGVCHPRLRQPPTTTFVGFDAEGRPLWYVGPYRPTRQAPGKRGRR